MCYEIRIKGFESLEYQIDRESMSFALRDFFVKTIISFDKSLQLKYYKVGDNEPTSIQLDKNMVADFNVFPKTASHENYELFEENNSSLKNVLIKVIEYELNKTTDDSYLGDYRIKLINGIILWFESNLDLSFAEDKLQNIKEKLALYQNLLSISKLKVKNEGFIYVKPIYEALINLVESIEVPE